MDKKLKIVVIGTGNAVSIAIRSLKERKVLKGAIYE